MRKQAGIGTRVVYHVWVEWCCMLHLDFVCQHPQVVLDALKKRRYPQSIEDILKLADQRRPLIVRRDALYTELKPLRELVQKTPEPEKKEFSKQADELLRDARRLDAQIEDIESRLRVLLLNIPNIPHQSVPVGVNENDDQEIRLWGDPPEFFFTPQAHWELGERLGVIDAEGGVRIAGSRFVALRGAAARLERALISFMIDLHTQEHGYTEVSLPFLVKRSVMVGAGQLPKFENQAYACSSDELFLNPTAEVPLLGLHMNSIISPDMLLPLRYVSWTTAFRREAGSATRQNRGLLRLHQFNKVELFQLVPPRDSYTAFDALLGHAEDVLQRLELPYRVRELCTASLPFTAAKTIDLEVWLPSMEGYVEISSVSNCESFQARRADIKYRATVSSGAQYVHTLNASGLAVGRTMAAILENFQQADGTIVIPKVLRPYMGTSLIAP